MEDLGCLHKAVGPLPTKLSSSPPQGHLESQPSSCMEERAPGAGQPEPHLSNCGSVGNICSCCSLVSLFVKLGWNVLSGMLLRLNEVILQGMQHTGRALIHTAAAADCSLQLCLTLCNPMDCSPPGSSVHGILQARILEWLAIPSSRSLPNPGMELGLPHLQADALPLSQLGSSQYTLPVIVSWGSIFQSTLFPNKLPGIRSRKIKNAMR